MRNLIVAAWLAMLAGCASTPNEPEPARPIVWKGEGLDYSIARPGGDLRLPDGVLRADLTLVDLDAEVAEGLLGIEGPDDIEARSLKQHMGEIAAVNACAGHGELLVRGTMELKVGETTPYEFKRVLPYLRDWRQGQESASPEFAECIHGVEARITVRDPGHAIQVDSRCMMLAQPVRTFTASSPGQPTAVQTPEVSTMQRVAAETIKPGETAMFQLGRGSHQGKPRIRLLFVRIN